MWLLAVLCCLNSSCCQWRSASPAGGSGLAGCPASLGQSKLHNITQLRRAWLLEVAADMLQEAAELLAAKSDWPDLYDMPRLGINEVPVVSATYVDDMYVAFDLAEETARRIRGISQWKTNEFFHSGIRDDGKTVLARLLGMLQGDIL